MKAALLYERCFGALFALVGLVLVGWAVASGWHVHGHYSAGWRSAFAFVGGIYFSAGCWVAGSARRRILR